MKKSILLYNTDALSFLKGEPDRAYSAACFSPPYGVGHGFDVHRDFGVGGAFTEVARELSRVCELWAVNLTQVIHNGRRSAFQEKFVRQMELDGVQCWDHWVITKPSVRPRRGPRALVQHESLWLFTMYPELLTQQTDPVYAARFRTVLPVTSHASSPVKELGTTPYFPEMPRAVFELYGRGGTVLDPFAGSGTSLRVAQELGLNSVGVELNPTIYAATCASLGVRP